MQRPHKMLLAATLILVMGTMSFSQEKTVLTLEKSIELALSQNTAPPRTDKC